MTGTSGELGVTSIDLAAIVGYFVIMAIFAYLTRRNRTFREFAVGKNSLPPLMVFASLAATIVGPGFSIGFTTKGYQTGYLFYFLCLSYALQTLLSGLFLAPRLNAQRDCTTLGDVMRKHYGASSQLLTGVISVGIMIGFTAVMGKIGATMLQAITGLPLGTCLIAVTGTTALLTFAGGLRATVATEALQFALKSIMVPSMLLAAIWKSPISLADQATKAWELTSSGFASMPALGLFGVFVSFLLGEVLLPPYANRALAARSSSASVSGFVMAGLFTVVWLGVVAVLGVVAHSILPANTSADTVFVAMGKHLLPAGIYGILLAAVMAIVMASQESVLNSGAVALVRDVISIVRQPTEHWSLHLVKLSTIAIAGLAIYVAQFAPSIIDGLLILYSIWAPTMLIGLLGALYGWRSTSASGWLSILSGGIASVIWQLLLKEPFGVPAILAGMIASAIGFVVGSRFGEKTFSVSTLEQTA
jgi:SSS family solute:Na+ symporter